VDSYPLRFKRTQQENIMSQELVNLRRLPFAGKVTIQFKMRQELDELMEENSLEARQVYHSICTTILMEAVKQTLAESGPAAALPALIADTSRTRDSNLKNA
jgi:hypothetical protein